MAMQKIQVVFDTNSVFTESEKYLLRRDVADIIRANSERHDLQIKWYLPEVVFHERCFRMQLAAQSLLPSLRRIEKLFDLDLKITQPKINAHVSEIAERQRKEFALEILPFNADLVDWQRIMLDAVYRKPPFVPGEKEKGFRDALICETVIQLASSSSVLTIFVAKDGYLKKAVNERALAAKAKHLKFLDSPEELDGFLFTVVEGLDEKFILELQRRAKAYLFEEGNKDTLFYRENIIGQIEARYKDKLESIPEGGDYVARGNWNIEPPIFQWKDGEKYHWLSMISLEVTAFKTTYTYAQGFSSSASVPVLSGSHGLSGSTYAFPAGQSPTILLSGYPAKETSAMFSSIPLQTTEVFVRGEILFKLLWNVVVTSEGGLASPDIEDIIFVETSWR